MYEKLIGNIMNNSLGGKVAGRLIVVHSMGFSAAPLVAELAARITAEGGVPDVLYDDVAARKRFLDNASAPQIEELVGAYEARFAPAGAIVRILAEDDMFALSDADPENLRLYGRLYGARVRDAIMLKRDWVLLSFPTPAYATAADMPFGAYSALWERVVSLDYSKMDTAMDPLKTLMEKTDRVHIKGPGTDLEFSIRGQPAIKCSGKCNIPDGEVYTAPVRESMNGVVRFNTPLVARTIQTKFENIRLEFKKGRIVSSHSDRNDAALARFFDTDEGARYTGEFALGVNPFVDRPVGEILFDEKISGSFHIAAGNCYDDCDNKNKSANHFDMICIQTPEKGGGEIWFDGALVRKDGRFVPSGLAGLNPENLR